MFPTEEIVKIANERLNTSYSPNDVKYCKDNTEDSNIVLKLGETHIAKLYWRKVDYDTEKAAVEKLKGCYFLVDDYTFIECQYNQTSYCLMLCKYVSGRTLLEYFKEYNALPTNFLEGYFEPRIEMLKHGVDDGDYKLDSLLWLPDGSVKKFDFDVVRLTDLLDLYQIQHLEESYNMLKQGSQVAWKALLDKPCFWGIPRSCFDEYRSKL